jgi:hypothetical protein
MKTSVQTFYIWSLRNICVHWVHRHKTTVPNPAWFPKCSDSGFTLQSLKKMATRQRSCTQVFFISEPCVPTHLLTFFQPISINLADELLNHYPFCRSFLSGLMSPETFSSYRFKCSEGKPIDSTLSPEPSSFMWSLRGLSVPRLPGKPETIVHRYAVPKGSQGQE